MKLFHHHHIPRISDTDIQGLGFELGDVPIEDGVDPVDALCKGLLGYLAGVSERNLYKNNFFVPIVAVLGATFLNALLYYLFSVLIGSNVGLERLLLSSIPDAVYNMCFSPVFYAIFYNFFLVNSDD